MNSKTPIELGGEFPLKVARRLFDGHISWPAPQVWLTLLCYADEDGAVDVHPEILTRLTGWSMELLRDGTDQLEKYGYLFRLYDHLNWGWWICDYENAFPTPCARPGGPEWETIKRYVFSRDGYRCQYCGEAGGLLEVDHVKAHSKGGSSDIDNLVTACKSCNCSKRDKSPDEWRKWKAEKA
jgi:hypothetical protein